MFGILAGYFFRDKIIIILSLILIFSVVISFKFKIILPFLFILLSIFSFLSTIHSFDHKNSYLYYSAQTEETVSVNGYVENISLSSSGREELTLKTDKINVSENEIKDVFKIEIILDLGQHAEIGQVINVKGKLLNFDENKNFGAFNEKLYMVTRGYDYKMFPDEIVPTDNFVSNYFIKSYKLKQRIENIYDFCLPEKESGILKAMIMGDRDNIDALIKELYKVAGISHILAISGLHVSIISAAMYFFLIKILNFENRICAVITILFTFAYMVFTGSSSSTVRATIMVTVILVGNVIFRSDDKLNTIAFAASIILLFQPLYLFDSGFQLSFTDVSCIFMTVSILDKFEIKSKVKLSLLISAAASFAVMPISAYYFYNISLFSMLANIIILPLVSIVLIFGIIVAVVGFLFLKVAVFLSGIIFVILNFNELVCNIIYLIPYSYVNTGRPNLISEISFYLIIVFTYCYVITERKNIFNLFFTSLSVIIFFVSINWNLITKNVDVCFVYVGQGDGAVINTYDNFTAVIDTGGNVNKKIGENTGEEDIYPYLKYSGIKDIDVLFITHMDIDHAAGAIELMDLIDIKSIVISDYEFGHGIIYSLIMKNANKHNIPVYSISSGSKLDINENMYIECLYPIDDKHIYNGDENHGSLVLKFNYKENSFLFTGDIGEDDEKLLNDFDVSSNILKVGHHGSKYSSSESFLDNVNPKLAIISSGENNLYGHPHFETIKKLNDRKIKYYNTAQSGAVMIKSNGIKYKIKTCRED